MDNMAKILKGKAVADSIDKETSKRISALKDKRIFPTIAVVRVGEKPDDIAYEKSILKRAEQLGITPVQCIYEESISQGGLIDEIERLNEDKNIHGVLIFRPLPGHIDENTVCESLDPKKDIDGITAHSMAGVFADKHMGYPPCTAQSCMEILKHYGYSLDGKLVTIMGRSLVIGKPVAMMAMRQNATVTVCHSKTSKEDLFAAGKNADIVIAAVGNAAMVTGDMLGKNQAVIDVGINVDESGNLCGDVDFQSAAENAAAITPVPGGVGSVTTSVLMKHVTEAAEKSI